MDTQTTKYKSEINISVEVTSETFDGQTLQRALYKAGTGMATAMREYLNTELTAELGQLGQDFNISVRRLVWDK